MFSIFIQSHSIKTTYVSQDHYLYGLSPAKPSGNHIKSPRGFWCIEYGNEPTICVAIQKACNGWRGSITVDLIAMSHSHTTSHCISARLAEHAHGRHTNDASRYYWCHLGVNLMIICIDEIPPFYCSTLSPDSVELCSYLWRHQVYWGADTMTSGSRGEYSYIS